MREVAIIGAGELGGLTAHILARRNLARHVRLVDDAGRVAEGKALDIAQAAPVEGFATRLSGHAEVSTAAGAAVIVIADRARGGEWQGDEGARLVQRLAQSAPEAVMVCAGAAQREIVEGAAADYRVARLRLFGTAPEALAGGVRALVALATNASPHDVALSVLGVPPSNTVIPWEDATLAGFALTRLLDETTRRRIAARAAALWPPGPYALAMAAALAVEAIAGRTRRVVSGFVAPDRSSGVNARTAAMPLRLGPAGIVEVVEPSLTVVDRIALENAVEL